MPWNWQLPDWPKFRYNPGKIIEQERKFLLGLGSAAAFLKNIDSTDYKNFVVEILSQEGLDSSKIEGEILDRESLQSSIKKQFGLQPLKGRERERETGMAELLCNVYETFNAPLTHTKLEQWHKKLFYNQTKLSDVGKYRTHSEPMQIVSSRLGASKVFFEAPPSAIIHKEMTGFINWFNSPISSEPILGKAAICHLYFENIHPFEDGNGRVGRLLIEKILSKSIGKPILIAVSKVLENRKKDYYAALEKCNRSLDADEWVDFFSEVVLQAQEESYALLSFLINKAKILTNLSGKINLRQEKALVRIFAEGLGGFKGGLSAENYIAITKASRATATRDLAELVNIGVLTKTGQLRHTRYWLNLNLETPSK